MSFRLRYPAQLGDLAGCLSAPPEIVTDTLVFRLHLRHQTGRPGWLLSCNL